MNFLAILCCAFLHAVIGKEPILSLIGLPSFAVDSNLLDIRVSWQYVKYSSKSSFIGVYACDDIECDTPEVFQKNAVQYKEVNKVKTNKANLRGVSDDENDKLDSASKGSTSFSIIIRSDIPAYQLAYVSGSLQYPEVNAISEPVVVPKEILYKPREVRLSLVAEQENAIRILWTESSLPKTSIDSKLLVGESTMMYSKRSSIVAKYNFPRELLCEGNLYPAKTIGYSPLGVQNEVVLTDLKPGKRYFYTIEYMVNGVKRRLPERSFINSNFASDMETNIIAFGDMGQSMQLIDGSLQHSFDNANHGEVAASYTASLLEKLIVEKDYDFISHFGDISYATGQLALWNSFFYSNQKVFASVPWMTGIGNHELGWSGSFVEGSDSQGECGVPYMFFFPFSSTVPTKAFSSNDWSMSSAIDKSYYSFKVKSVYNIMMSTETDFSPGSDQYVWLTNELRKAQKLKMNSNSPISWVLFTGHRPMYISDKYPELVSKNLLKDIESLLQQNDVDIALWGHHHSYQRFKCKVYEEACHQGGVVQIVSGHAGFSHSPISYGKYETLFAIQDNTHWGVSTLSFKNSTHCEVQYVENREGKVLDSFWIRKSSTWLS